MGAAVARGGGRHRYAVPPRVLVVVRRFLRGGVRELHRKRRTTNKRQSKVDEGCLLTRGSQFRAPTTPLPKDTICHWDWGEGVAGFNLAQKGRAGDEIIMRWMMTTTTKGKSIYDSMSEPKCIVSSNIIYSITVYHTNKQNSCSSVSVTRLKVLNTELRDSLNLNEICTTKKIEILVKDGVNHPDIEEENLDKEALERLTGWIHNSHFTDNKLYDKCINDVTVDIGKNKDWSISDYQEERQVTIEGDVYLDAITGEYYDDKKNGK